MTTIMKRPLPASILETTEGRRLAAANGATWRRWGPYLSDRQWGTVREDYSPRGDAWDYLSHDQARSRAYRWGEDGIGGFGDERLRICLAVALWNGRDPILKERLFGLTNAEGNHGEDVKELYYYLDGVPSHAYMRMLYKYPQAEFPYARLVEESRRSPSDLWVILTEPSGKARSKGRRAPVFQDQKLRAQHCGNRWRVAGSAERLTTVTCIRMSSTSAFAYSTVTSK